MSMVCTCDCGGGNTVVDKLYGPRFYNAMEDDWFCSAVEWAVQSGVSSGYPGARFAPDDKVNRDQFAAMLHGYAEEPESNASLNFADSKDISGWAGNTVRWAVENHLMSGVPEHKILPGGLPSTVRPQSS